MRLIVALVVAASILTVLLYHFGQHNEAPQKVGNSSAATSKEISNVTEVAKAKQQVSAKSAKTRMTPEEMKKKEAELLSKMAKLTEPEEARKKLQSTMARREPGYRALFDAWQLDPQTSQKIMQMIWDRDWEQELWILRPEASNVETSRASSEEKRGKKYLWDSHLADLIGDERFRRLRKVEDDDQASMEIQFRKIRGLDD